MSLKMQISLLGLGIATVAGCGREDSIQAYDAAKDPPPATQVAAAVPGMRTMPPATGLHGGAAPVAEAPASDGGLHWTTPPGWKELPASGMRVATFIASENPKLELSVIPLEGGELLPNLNRWEDQLGLPASSADKLAEVVKPLAVNGLDIKLVDLTGPESKPPVQRMLAAIVPFAGRFWFFKMSGPVEPVTAQKEKFDALIRSLTPGTVATAQALSAAPPQATAPSVPMNLAHWTAPSDWKEIPGSKLPRVLAFQVGSADQKPDQKTEMIVTRFAADNAGSFLDNVNRWRNQIGLGPVKKPSAVQMDDVKVGKSDNGVLLEFHNPETARRMLVVLASAGGDLWFYKVTGPADVVEAQKPNMLAFMKSVEFEPAK